MLQMVVSCPFGKQFCGHVTQYLSLKVSIAEKGPMRETTKESAKKTKQKGVLDIHVGRVSQE